MNAHKKHTFSFTENTKAVSNERPTILVIDDSEQLLSLLETLLSQYNYDVLLANSGSNGIDTFIQDGADVVLCDLALPDLDGWNVAQFIQEYCISHERHKPPFILMTGWAQEIDLCGVSTESGVDMVLDKPMDTKQLLKTIKHFLDRQEDISELQFNSVQNGMNQ